MRVNWIRFGIGFGMWITLLIQGLLRMSISDIDITAIWALGFLLIALSFNLKSEAHEEDED